MKGRLTQFLSVMTQFQGLQQKFYGVPESTYEWAIENFAAAPDVQRYFKITDGSDKEGRTAKAIREYLERKGVRAKAPKPSKTP